MKKLIAVVILISVFFVFQVALASQQLLGSEKKSLDISIKKLYSAPLEESNLVFNIPIEVKLLDISADGNWYKVKISYGIGPLNYTYVGWTHIPVGEIITRREKQPPEIASSLNHK